MEEDVIQAQVAHYKLRKLDKSLHQLIPGVLRKRLYKQRVSFKIRVLCVTQEVLGALGEFVKVELGQVEMPRQQRSEGLCLRPKPSGTPPMYARLQLL